MTAPIGHNRPPPNPKPPRDQLRRELLRMISARKVTAEHLDGLGKAAEREAEARAIAAAGFSFGRHASDWRRRHETLYRVELQAGADRRRREVEALTGKLGRQVAAIAAFARKHGFAVSPYDQVEDRQARPQLKRYVPRRLRA